jgi:hypothetical protein
MAYEPPEKKTRKIMRTKGLSLIFSNFGGGRTNVSEYYFYFMRKMEIIAARA